MRHSGLAGAGRKLVLKRFSSNSVIVLLFFMDFVCVFAVVLRVCALGCLEINLLLGLFYVRKKL